jgi:hypothetical protein
MKKEFIEFLVKQSNFNSNNDKKWKEWKVEKYKGWKDLLSVINNDEFDLDFKKRAMFILVVSPFENIVEGIDNWCGEASQYFYKADFFKKDLNFTPELAEYTALLLGKLYVEFADCKKGNIFLFLPSAMINLLPHLSDENADELFGLFHIGYSLHRCNIYNKLGFIFINIIKFDFDLDIKWKRIVDRDLRNIIYHEFERDMNFMEENTQVINYYVSPLAHLLSMEKLLESVELLDFYVDQINFIIDITEKYNKCVLHGYNLDLYFEIFSDEKYRDFRYKITRHLVLNKVRKFKVTNKKTFDILNVAIQQFGEDDEELKEGMEMARYEVRKKIG